ncbi:MAG: hypothetical protein AMJ46_10980 [Latescibacteria bacterium DG_63]|nr:MAG: hypothetical protein AMJ46_10980 [Latescibacteria bacterium DG_63]
MKSWRIAIGLAALAVLILMLTVAAAETAKEKYEEKFESTEKLSRDGKVYLSNISGNVRILTWKKSEVKIDALKVSRAGSMEEAKERAALVKIEVKGGDDQLEIRTEYPKRRTKKSLNVSVEYTLTIPDRAEAMVKNVSGNIDAENLGGLAKLETVSGNVTVDGVAEGGVFGAVSGNVNLRNVGGDVDAQTVSGNISLEKVSGRVDAETVSGGVKVKNLSGVKSADIEVHSGTIVFEGALNRDGRYFFQTHSGNITLHLPKDSDFDFNFRSFSGNIHSEFKVIAELQGKLKQLKRDVYGKVGGGGADVTVNTFSGDVRLKKLD